MTASRRVWVRTLLLVAAGAAVLAVTLTASASGNAPHQGSHRPAATARGSAHVAAKLRAAFARLRHPHPAAESAAGGNPAVHEPVLSADQMGLDAAAAQTVELASSEEIGLYPGANGACMSWPTSSDTSAFMCGETSGVTDGRFWTVGPVPGTSTNAVFGMVPDGNRTVSVTQLDGTTEVAPVEGNMFFAGIGDARTVKSVQDLDAAGQPQSYPGVPAEAFAGGSPPTQ